MKFLIWLFHIVISFIIILVLDLVVHFASNQLYTTGYIIKFAIVSAACASAARMCKKHDRRRAAREKSGNSSEVTKVKRTYTSNSIVINDFIDKIEESSIRRNEIQDNIKPSEPDFGYCKTNPIGTSSVESSEKYLSLLRNKEGKEFFWMRKESICVESFGNVDNVMVDVYHLYLDGLVYKDVYICPHSNDSTDVPRDFVLAEEDNRESLGSVIAEAKQKNVSILEFLNSLQAKT